MAWRLHRRLERGTREGERGQALVEFAIVAPLIVMVLLFAMWFYELIFVRLKAQEAARYAAWEATAYKLHDYQQGPSALNGLATTMTTSIMADTATRYADLNSADQSLLSYGVQSGLQHGRFAASWFQPVVLVTNHQEEQVPGGWVPNLLLNIAGNIYDWISAINYENMNPVATALIAAGKDHGGAMTSRMFGDSSWGFNRSGYAQARVGVMVTNEFFNRGVGRFLVSHDPTADHESGSTGSASFMVWETHGVLADSWRLDEGGDVWGGSSTPGRTNTSFAKQVERMYLVKNAARQVAKTYATVLWAAGQEAMAAALAPGSALTVQDMTRAAVVSRSYGATGTNAGKAGISQDGRPEGTTYYDTVPATSSEGSEELQEYGKTLENRGPHFMGCDKEMSLGCPSSTLSQDNPFGSYVARE